MKKSFFFLAIFTLAVSGCSQKTRGPASDEDPSKFAGAADANQDAPQAVSPPPTEERDCYVGEHKDSEGHCVRAQEIQRPARRGGR